MCKHFMIMTEQQADAQHNLPVTVPVCVYVSITEQYYILLK